MYWKNIRRVTISCLAIVAIAALSIACAQTDAGITAKVKTKLAADDLVKAHEINVTTNEGVVTLTGNVDNAAAKERALAIARGTEGVVGVQDMIAARTARGSGNAPEPSRTAGQAIDDASITMRVKGRLLDDPVVKGLVIDVDTRQGVVYLTGRVRTAQEREQAIRLARETPGVQDVESNLELERA